MIRTWSLVLGLVSVLTGPIIISARPEQSLNRPGLSLRETFDLYVKAVQSSDLEGLFSTVTDRESFVFLTSTGRLINTRKGYREFHEEWFKEKDWEMPVDTVSIQEAGESGRAMAQFHYRQKTADGRTTLLDSWFTLFFEREGGMWKVTADVCTPIRRATLEPGEATPYSVEQESVFAALKGRRTVRKFKPDPVPEEHLKKILDAARFAPTAGNEQPWTFLVVRNREKLNRLARDALSWFAASRSEQAASQGLPPAEEARFREVIKNALGAPVYVAVLVDAQAKYPAYIMTDGALAAGSLMIAARALGYGTGFFTTFFPEEKMKAFFGIPDRYKLVCFTPIGVPEQWPPTPPKKQLENIVVYEGF
jgi:nitroreductase/ketosteroid isomerase-like protein